MEDSIYQRITLRRIGSGKKFNEIKMNAKITPSAGQIKIMHPSKHPFLIAPLSMTLALIANSSFVNLAWGESVGAAPHSKPASQHDASEKPAEKQPEQPPIENVVSVSTNDLVDKPHDYLGKNIKFTAKFSNFTSLALDYKPAMRSSKNFLSFLVLRPEAHVPFSELKLAMAIPKEKDPESQLLTSLKEGDQVEIIGKVFAAPLDEPWVDVLRLKKLASAEDEKKGDKKISASSTNDDKKKADSSAESEDTAHPTKPGEKEEGNKQVIPPVLPTPPDIQSNPNLLKNLKKNPDGIHDDRDPSK